MVTPKRWFPRGLIPPHLTYTFSLDITGYRQKEVLVMQQTIQRGAAKLARFSSRSKFVVLALLFVAVSMAGVYQAAAAPLEDADGEFTALTPSRILNTFDGTGGI